MIQKYRYLMHEDLLEEMSKDKMFCAPRSHASFLAFLPQSTKWGVSGEKHRPTGIFWVKTSWQDLNKSLRVKQSSLEAGVEDTGRNETDRKETRMVWD